MRPKGPIYNKNEVRTPKVQNVTLEDETSQSLRPQGGKLNSQLPGVITFAYDLRFGRLIAHWKGLSNIYNFWSTKCILMASIWPQIAKKCCLGPQNNLVSLGLKKPYNNN